MADLGTPLVRTVRVSVLDAATGPDATAQHAATRQQATEQPPRGQQPTDVQAGDPTIPVAVGADAG